jgi:tetratricopeptide (TPR) repeat protein
MPGTRMKGISSKQRNPAWHTARAAGCGIAFLLLAFTGFGSAEAQCSPSASDAAMQQARDRKDWAGVVALARAQTVRSADANFAYGMALAHLNQFAEARAALLAGYHACPGQKRFPTELAGIAFERKRYPEAATWLRRTLRLDPHDNYANNFAGTVYFLMGNLPAALEYWNHDRVPQIAALSFDPQLCVRRLLLDRAFTFSPQALLQQSQLATTEARVAGLGLFPAYNIVLNARRDGSFDASFHAIERDGFGATRLQAVVSTFSGLPYETIYPTYYDIGRSAMNVQSLLRWDKEKRRAWVSLSSPLRDLPQNRWSLSADARDENWAMRRSFTGTAPVLGSLNLQTQTATGSLTSFPSGRLQWSLGASYSHRSYRNVVDGTALNPQLILPGSALGFLGSVEGKALDIPDRRFTLTTSASSETTRLWSSPPHLVEKLEGSALAHWFPQAQSNTWEATQRVRAGGLMGVSPFDQLFMLGVERDNNLWLRGHIGSRNGKKGSSPVGTDYFLSNSDLDRRVYSNGLLGVQVGPLLDIGRMAAPTPGLSTGQWLFDTGVEAKLTVLGTNVVLTWGRDLRTGNNAFYGTAQ